MRATSALKIGTTSAYTSSIGRSLLSFFTISGRFSL
jgi:hypothetical protein